MIVEFGLIRAKNHEEETRCCDNKCDRFVYTNDFGWIDVQSSKMYCDSCGKCMRYERKMEKKRETMQKQV